MTFLFLGLLAAALVLFWWYRRERGPSLRLTAAEAIPADRCIAYLAFHNAGDFLDTLRSTPAFQADRPGTAKGNPGPSQVETIKFESLPDKVPAALGVSGWEDLIRRVAADSIELVLIDTGPRPGLAGTARDSGASPETAAVLLWLRPRLGWRGDLATLIGPLSTGKNVVSVRTAGARFYSYRDQHVPTRGVAWTRLGPTVLVRLDSSDPGPFEEVLSWAGDQMPQKGSSQESVRLTALAAEPDFARLRDARGGRPGLWGYIRALRTFHCLDSHLPGGLSRWIDPAWLPALEEPIRECPLLLVDSDLSLHRGLEIRLRWTRPGDSAGEGFLSRREATTVEEEASFARSSTAKLPDGGGDISPVPLMRLQTESRRIPEIIHWITLVSRSVAQVAEEEEEAETEEKKESAAGRIEPAPRTPEEKAVWKNERRLQKECQKALLRELADPRTTARLVSALGGRVELDILHAGLSSGGRWKPDWDFVAAVRDETRLRTAAEQFFEGVEDRQSAAVLRAPVPTSADPVSGPAPAPGSPIDSPDILLTSTATLSMDLRGGRFLLRIPGDTTLRIGLHRYRLPGESNRSTDSTAVPVPAGLISHFGPNSIPEAHAGDGSTTPTVELEVDWPRLATHLEILVHDSEEDPRRPAARPGVRQFRDWARALAPTGVTRFIISRRSSGAQWMLRVPLGS